MDSTRQPLSRARDLKVEHSAPNPSKASSEASAPDQLHQFQESATRLHQARENVLVIKETKTSSWIVGNPEVCAEQRVVQEG